MPEWLTAGPPYKVELPSRILQISREGQADFPDSQLEVDLEGVRSMQKLNYYRFLCSVYLRNYVPVSSPCVTLHTHVQASHNFYPQRAVIFSGT